MPGQGTYSANQARIFPGYARITEEDVNTNSNYNALEAELRMEERHGLSLELAYTWSHEIDVISSDLGTVSNPFNVRYDRGSGSLDRRHIFNANYIYRLPFFNKSSSWLERQALGGWEVSGMTVAESGSPRNVSCSPDTLGLGGGTSNRPNRTGSGRVAGQKTQSQWFTTTAFPAPVAPWAGGANPGFGNAGKDAVVGPGLFNTNLALFKTFPLSESGRTSLELRAESFNTFNHTEFQSIDTGFTDPTFGQVTSTYDTRVLQFGGKLNF